MTRPSHYPDKSLLRRASGDVDGTAADGTEADPADPADDEPRVRMLETVREFGLVQPSATGGEAGIRQAHAAYYLAPAAEAKPRLFGPNQTRWLTALKREGEGDNLRAGLADARARADAALGVRLAGTLYQDADDSPISMRRRQAGAPAGKR